MGTDAAVSHSAPPRVLLLIWAGVLRGAERHVFDLAKALPGHGYEPMVCFFSRAESYGDALTDASVPFIELESRSSKFDPRDAVRFIRLLRRAKFDIVHDHGAPLWARVAVRFAAPKVPLLYTEHVTHFTTLRRFGYGLVRPFTNAHIAVSSAACEALVHQLRISAEEVTIVPNCVDPERFPPVGEVQRCKTRHQLGLGEEGALLISVGRLTQSKQFDRLIRVLRPLLDARPELHLAIVGDGEERIALMEQIAQAQLGGQVHLLGSRLDVPELLGAADLFVFASGQEAFGIAVAEAMMSGMAVVALRVPGVEEVVAAGETGLLIDDATMDTAFARSVAELLDDPVRREEFGRRGRLRALELFHPRRATASVAKVYSRLLADAQRCASV